MPTTCRNQYRHEDEHEQSNVDSDFPPIFIDSAAAFKNGRPYEMECEQYSGDYNIGRSIYGEEQNFIASNNKSSDETMRNKKTKQLTLDYHNESNLD